MEFKQGDKVEWLGSTGVVRYVEEIYIADSYPVKVGFDSGYSASFTLDGRYYDEQEPSLNLIEIPKKLVKKRVIGWINIYDTTHDSTIYGTKELALLNERKPHHRIATVELTGEYEVEES